MFKYWDWDDTWHVIGMSIVVAALTFLGFVFAAPHNVDYYYLSNATNKPMAACVYAHWTWHPDEISFCTNNKDEALDFVLKANQTY